jgi:tetratricopeptide (TPR) repeat protein
MTETPPELADFILPRDVMPADPTVAPPSQPPSGAAAEPATPAAPAGADGAVSADKPSRPARRMNQSRVIVLLIVLMLVEAAVVVWALHPARKRHWEAEVLAREQATAQEQATFRLRLDEVIARGDAAMLAGDLVKAVACYRDAQTMDPADRRVVTIMALATAAMRDRASSLESAQRAALNRMHLEELKGRVDRLIELGDVEARAGRMEEALKFYGKALATAPENRGIQSLISRTEERLRADALAKSGATRSPDAVARARELIAQGDAKRDAGALPGAMTLYTEALLLVPDDAEIRRRVEDLSVLLAQRGAPERKRDEWTLDVRVGASTVRSVDLGGGTVVDMLVTANGGVIRVGRLDALGKAVELFYENPHPRSSGSAAFSAGGNAYTLQWDLDKGSSLPSYHIAVRKVK